jgi:membrane protein implicated in regulation of membrane protease activity
MDFLGAKWLWLYAGAFLMLAELMAPGFVVFFFGLAAATVGLVMFVLPDAFHLTPTWQIALFSFFSILYLVTLRRYVKSVFLGDTDESKTTDEYVGRLAKVTETVRPETPGRVMLGDAEWTAVASERLDPGTEVKVTGRKNLTLEVERVV